MIVREDAGHRPDARAAFESAEILPLSVAVARRKYPPLVTVAAIDDRRTQTAEKRRHLCGCRST